MRLFITLLFLTLVGNTGTAAPSPAPDVRDTPRQSENPSNPDPMVPETLRLSQPPGNLDNENFAVPRKKIRGDWDLWLLAGASAGSFLKKDSTETNATLGAMASWNPDFHRAWDFQADFGFEDWIRVSVALRQPFMQDRLFRPYWKYGISQAIESERMAASLVDLERIKIFGAMGLLDLLDLDEKWNVELGVAWGMVGPAAHLQTGWRY